MERRFEILGIQVELETLSTDRWQLAAIWLRVGCYSAWIERRNRWSWEIIVGNRHLTLGPRYWLDA